MRSMAWACWSFMPAISSTPVAAVPTSSTMVSKAVAASVTCALARWTWSEASRAIPTVASNPGHCLWSGIVPDSRADAALNVLLVASILLAAGSVTYAVAVPKEGEQFTEFYLLTENESGDLVAAGYPTNMTRGQSASLVVGIGNQEHEQVEYTVVVELQRVEITDNATNVTVLDERELRRFTVDLAHNETWHNQHTVTPTMTGERLRLQYLLYRGEPPADPTVENAYRELHLWVNVSARG